MAKRVEYLNILYGSMWFGQFRSSKWNYHQRRRRARCQKLTNMLGGNVVEIAIVFHTMVM